MLARIRWHGRLTVEGKVGHTLLKTNGVHRDGTTSRFQRVFQRQWVENAWDAFNKLSITGSFNAVRRPQNRHVQAASGRPAALSRISGLLCLRGSRFDHDGLL